MPRQPALRIEVQQRPEENPISRVIKFGGAALGNADRIFKAKAFVDRLRSTYGTRIAVVVSAFEGVTDELIQLAQLAKNRESWRPKLSELYLRHTRIIQQCVPKDRQREIESEITSLFNAGQDCLRDALELASGGHGGLGAQISQKRLQDYIVSFGERASSIIFAAVCAGADYQGVKAFDARSTVRTKATEAGERVDYDETNRRLKELYTDVRDDILVITGYIAGQQSDGRDITTNLDRGGTDFTATLLASAVLADEVVLVKLCDGVMTADPRDVGEHARSIDEMHYDDGSDLAAQGGKVIHPLAVLPIKEKNIPLRVVNLENESFEGTLIHSTPKENGDVIAITSLKDLAVVEVKGPGVMNVLGSSERGSKALHDAGVNIVYSSQGGHQQIISYAISKQDASRAANALNKAFAEEIKDQILSPVEAGLEKAIIATVGRKARASVKSLLMVATALDAAKINPSNLVRDDNGISFVVGEAERRQAVKALHATFIEKTHIAQ